MTFPERRLEWPLDPPETHAENVQDVIPPTERNQDPVQTEMTQGMTLDGSRPLTEAERRAADHDTPVGERVYAPASERVPREPVPGHRDFVEHPDTHTPERQAVAGGEEEPSFTRVPRPSTLPDEENVTTNVTTWNNAAPARGNSWVPVAVGWAVGCGTCAGVAGWMWWRWQRERNKPINRIRRQARQTAYEIRERMPDCRVEVLIPDFQGMAEALKVVLDAQPEILLRKSTDGLWEELVGRSERKENTI